MRNKELDLINEKIQKLYKAARSTRLINMSALHGSPHAAWFVDSSENILFLMQFMSE